MPRRREVPKRSVFPDPIYGNELVNRMVNKLMWDGKKSVIQRVFYEAMDTIAQKIKDAEPLEVFEKAIGNVKPMVEVRSKRVGGANYQVPMQVNAKRRLSLSIRWIRDAVRAASGQPMAQRLANELIAAYKGEGTAMRTRENVHRMAEANKAFAHFAW